MTTRTPAIIGNPERITAFQDGDLIRQSQFFADHVIDHGAGGFLDSDVHDDLRARFSRL